MSTATFVIAPGNVNSALLYHINLFLLSIVSFFIIAKLPRVIALFGTTSEWFDGHFLHYTPHAKRATEKGGVTMRYPPHVDSCIKFLRPLLKYLRLRISPGFSIAQSLILVIYFACLAYASLYKSNIFTDSSRTGWVATAQLPLLFALAQKNNVLGLLLGCAYENLNFLHRFTGRLVVVAANIHSLYHFYSWFLNGTAAQMFALNHNIWGLVALVCVDLMWFFSTRYWRERAHNIFFRTHIVGSIFVLLATYFHEPQVLPYIFASTGIFVFDYLLRILKSRLTTAVIIPVPELNSTRVEISKYNAGWRAGQHIRLRVLSMGMGRFGWAEVHPFSIASVSRGQEGIVLICKKTGTWTKNLFELAKLGGYINGEIGRKVRVVIEGPYGGPGHTVFSSFSAAVVVAGGSGITFALSVIQDLIQKDLEKESRVKVIELIWIIQDSVSLTALLPTLSLLIEQSIYTPLSIKVFYTRAPTGKSCFGPETYFRPGLTLAPGRPRFSKVLDGVVSRAVGLSSGVKDEEGITGMVVAVCGPTGLADDVVEAVNGVEAIRRDQVGGIEIHEEVFGM